ncbi:MAG: anti-sigma factor [Bacteroidota bacterium]|nr:anti-sigma factor [Bacteroidota bacterium]
MDIKAYIETGVIESYVLGMAEAQEVAELERLRLQYPEIQEAIDSFEAALEKQAMAAATAPSPQVKANLLASLNFEKEEEKTKRVSMNLSRFVAAASIILLVASAALNVYYYNQFKSTSLAYQALLVEKNSLFAENQNSQTKALDLYNSMQLMSDPSFTKISMPGIPGKEGNLATVFWNEKSKDVYLLANKLPSAAPDKQYQLWAIVDGKPVDAGLIGACAGLCKMKNIPKASLFAITLEKKGGSPTPTLDQMYVAGKVG